MRRAGFQRVDDRAEVERIAAGIAQGIRRSTKQGRLAVFPLFKALFALLAIGGLVAAWKSARRSRVWLVLSAGTSVVVSAALIFCLAPLVQGMFQRSIAGDLPVADIAAGVEQWQLGNRIRLIVELFGFIFSIIALRVWSAENASPYERAS